MINLTVGDLLEATGGELLHGDTGLRVHTLNTDSRAITPGDAFVALCGERFNGHMFIPQALAQGAKGLVVSELELAPVLKNKAEWILRVPDTLVALGAIARCWKRILNPRTISITGSCGKTTVKEMTAHVCRAQFETHATPGNFNNEIGLPLTLFQLEQKHQVVVCEVGMNHGGELTRLAGICEPHISLITNVGDAHIGNFANKEALRAAKAELFHSSPLDAVLILGTDCPSARHIADEDLKGRTLRTFGTTAECTVRAVNLQNLGPEQIAFNLEYQNQSVPVAMNVFGIHQVQNALAAATVALELGMKLEGIAAQLQTFRSSNQRSVLKQLAGITFVEDYYNASPTATVQALRSLKYQFPNQRRVAVLGEMAELGNYSETMHRKVARECVAQQISFVFTVGEKSRWYQEEIAVLSSIPTLHARCVEDLAGLVIPYLEEGDVVMIKGSRTNKLEIFMNELEATLGGKETAV
jgi:UDP-N-acetylmuramoyl-tripeptide--D-alanyl-D-alanine ligase